VGAGTGLDLATVYGIVKGHRGHLACRSRIGEGTVFTIFLPRTAEIDAERLSGEPGPGEPTGAPVPFRRGATVSLVDDEEETRKAASERLETRGYRVLTAGSGEEALEVYRRSGERIEAVIPDWARPAWEEQGCLEELCALDPAVRVIVTTGYGEALPAGPAGKGRGPRIPGRALPRRGTRPGPRADDRQLRGKAHRPPPNNALTQCFHPPSCSSLGSTEAPFRAARRALFWAAESPVGVATHIWR